MTLPGFYAGEAGNDRNEIWRDLGRRRDRDPPPCINRPPPIASPACGRGFGGGQDDKQLARMRAGGRRGRYANGALLSSLVVAAALRADGMKGVWVDVRPMMRTMTISLAPRRNSTSRTRN